MPEFTERRPPLQWVGRCSYRLPMCSSLGSRRRRRIGRGFATGATDREVQSEAGEMGAPSPALSPHPGGEGVSQTPGRRSLVVLRQEKLPERVIILSLLISNLIIVYSFIVAPLSYVDKLAPAAQSSVFKRRTVIALK